MQKEKREKLLQNMGIITLILVSMYYINLLFNSQISILLESINAIVLPFGIALFISYLLAPIIAFLEKRFKIKNRIYSIIIVFILLAIVTALFVIIVGNIIYSQATLFIEQDWSNILIWIEDFVASNSFLQDGYDQISEYLTFDTAAPVIFDVFNVFRGIVTMTIAIVLVPVFLVFLLSDKNTIFKGILSLVPKKYQTELVELGKRANDVTERYFNGRFLTMFIMSVFFTIIFIIFGFGIDKAVFFGFTLGFLDLIPYIGGTIGILLPILYSFTIIDSVLFGQWAFVGLIAINLVAQGIQGSILQPIIMGKEVKLHPLLVLSSFIFFGALFGITGVILAIPITGTIKTTLEYYREAHDG